MATVGELQAHVQRVASLNTSDAAEAAMVIAWLNEAYRQSMAKTGRMVGLLFVTFTAESEYLARADYAAATPTTGGVTTVKSVVSGTGGTLRRVNLETILSKRSVAAVSANTEPQLYCPLPNDDIELWPSAASGTELTLEVEHAPLTLVASGAASGEETTPSAMPTHFHYDLLGNFAIARAFEYRGDMTRAQYFRTMYQQGMQELQAWINEQGGVNGPAVVLKRTTQSYAKMPGQI